jgi:hypothetical protein
MEEPLTGARTATGGSLINDQHDNNSANMPPEKPACSVETPTIADMLANAPAAMKEILRRPSDWTTCATAVLWPCSPDASFVIGHAALVVDAGYTSDNHQS